MPIMLDGSNAYAPSTPRVTPRPAEPPTGTTHATPPQQGDSISTSREGDSGSTTASLAGAAQAIGTTIVDRTGQYEHVANGKLTPNASIQENGYTFTTDGQGRVASASGKLSLNPSTGAERSKETKAAQREVGWEDRLPDDHGGHIIADRFNGPGDLKNLFAQNGNFNLGAYKKLENGWAKALAQGRPVDVKVSLRYPEGSLRPDQISVKTRIGSGPIINNVFDNAPGGKAFATASESDPAGHGTVAQVARDGENASRMSKLAKGAEIAGKIATPVAIAADGYSLYSAYQQDGDRIGQHTVEQAGSVAGGWAGAAAGAEVGAEGGAAIGSFFFGAGAVPGAIVGGAIGGVVGGIAGSSAGKAVVNLGEDGIDLGKKAVSSVAHFFGL